MIGSSLKTATKIGCLAEKTKKNTKKKQHFLAISKKSSNFAAQIEENKITKSKKREYEKDISALSEKEKEQTRIP